MNVQPWQSGTNVVIQVVVEGKGHLDQTINGTLEAPGVLPFRIGQ